MVCMETRSLKFIATACGGELLSGAGQTPVRRVCTDSRQAQAGDLFFALRGEHFDGHNFLDDAARKGAVAVGGGVGGGRGEGRREKGEGGIAWQASPGTTHFAPGLRGGSRGGYAQGVGAAGGGVSEGFWVADHGHWRLERKNNHQGPGGVGGEAETGDGVERSQLQ